MAKHICKQGEAGQAFSREAKLTHADFLRLGIAQHLIRSGIARLEIIRAETGKIENIFVKVRHLISLSI